MDIKAFIAREEEKLARDRYLCMKNIEEFLHRNASKDQQTDTDSLLGSTEAIGTQEKGASKLTQTDTESPLGSPSAEAIGTQEEGASKLPDFASTLHFADGVDFFANLGAYEGKKKRLAEERHADYVRHLEETEKKENAARRLAKERRQSSGQLAYEDMLQHRLDEEREYRNVNRMDMPYDIDDLKISNIRIRAKSDKRRKDALMIALQNIAQKSSDYKPLSISESPSIPVSHAPSSTSSSHPTHQAEVHAAALEPGKRPNSVPPANFPVHISRRNTSYSPPISSEEAKLRQLLYMKQLEKQVVEKEGQLLMRKVAEEGHRYSASLPLKETSEKNQKYEYKRQLDEQVRQNEIKRYIESSTESEASGELRDWFFRSGGGGAPLKDAAGNIITSRRRFSSASHLGSQLNINQRQNEQDRQKQQYIEELRKQMDEKKRLDEMRKEKERLEEETAALRIEQQRMRIQHDYEREQAELQRKKEKMQLKMERLNEFQVKQRQEQEQRQTEEAERRRQRAINVNIERCAPATTLKTPSPPVPAVRTQALLDRMRSCRPIPGRPKDIASIKPENVMSQLSELRQLLLQDQDEMDRSIREKKQSYKVMNRRVVEDDSDDDDDVA